MKIVESIVKGKRNDGYCEDILTITDHFIAVIDGVTPKSDFTCGKKKTGRIAAELIEKAVKKSAPDADCGDIIKNCNAAFEDFYKQTDFPYNKKEYGLQAVGAIYSVAKREIWLIGDCQAMVDGVPYTNIKKSDVILAGLRSMILHLEKDKAFDGGSFVDEGRKAILPWIVQSTAFANRNDTPYGYALINGDKIPESLIKRIRLPEKSSEVVLASDGYPILFPTLQQSEDELTRLLHEDPYCFRFYASTKGIENGNISFDDRTYVRFTA
ncbi:hypothetical protein HRQ91_04695 [Treponema parvum]|uniref:Uncharacterized protein n=1 Tax=Treponema parvum TaxID=138851 RepID=A0A975IEG8_9SPIR|nr:hypothetical protein [Treponema parvum]QTQ13812.1 hypothetical protein HRQ91_04695 [Treponema parvum]